MKKILIVSGSINLSKSLVAFIMNVLIARILNVDDYGLFVFINSIFASYYAFADLGFNTKYFSHISAYPESIAQGRTPILFSLMGLFFGLVLVVPSVYYFSKGADSFILILLGCLSIYSQQRLLLIITQFGEALRKPIVTNFAILMLSVLILTAIFLLNEYFLLSVNGVYITIIIFNLIFSFLMIRIFLKVKTYDNDEIKIKEIFKATKSMIPYVFISSASGFVVNWMLEYYGGVELLAYIGIGRQLTGLTVILSASVLRIIWREASFLNSVDRMIEFKTLYLKSFYLIFAFSFIGMFYLYDNASFLIKYIFGDKFIGASEVVMILSIYAIHQSIGSINSSFMFSKNLQNKYSLFGSIGHALIILFIPVLLYSGVDIFNAYSLVIILVQLVISHIYSFIILDNLKLFYRLMAFQVILIFLFSISVFLLKLGLNYFSAGGILIYTISYIFVSILFYILIYRRSLFNISLIHI